jgi:hypothetical protein
MNYARIIRMVPIGTLPDGVICEFDKEKNLLRIDDGYYDRANDRQKREIWRSKSTIIARGR